MVACAVSVLGLISWPSFSSTKLIGQLIVLTGYTLLRKILAKKDPVPEPDCG